MNRALVALLALLVVAWLVMGPDEEAADAPETDGERSAARGDSAERPDAERSPGAGPRSGRPHGRTFVVAHVVDGDTVDLADGRTVRLAGIDTPEVGECGYEQAKSALEGLVLGRRVVLVASDEDEDQYGRLLRYLEVRRGGRVVDAGLRLIRRGVAVARYDSRDGYGFHPRENRYVAADGSSPDPGCGNGVRGLVGQPRPRSGCDAGYSPCVPPYPPDVDCGDLSGPVRVTGRDAHGLDADGDGRACEG